MKKAKIDELLGDKTNSADLDSYYDKHDVDEMINDANELIRAVEDQLPTLATQSNFVQKAEEDLDQTIQGGLCQQLDERVPFDSMSDNLYLTKFDALEGLITSENFTDQFLDNADKTDLDSYVTLGTAQSINANKTFNNSCRFTSSIDGMSTITGSSFVKSGADDIVVLLGADGTKPVSEFSSSIDDSNYVKKTGETSQTIDGSLKKIVLNSLDAIDYTQYMAKYEMQLNFVQKQGEVVQYIDRILRKQTNEEPGPEPTDEDYITLGAVKSEFVSSQYSCTINGNLIANQFIKSRGIDQQVLLANGAIKAISEFGSGSVDDSNYVKKTGDNLQIIQEIIRRGGFEPEIEELSDDDDYVTRRAVVTQFITIFGEQQIVWTKTFYGNVTANGFVKSGGTNQYVLFANGTIKPFLEFTGGSVDDSNYVKKTQDIRENTGSFAQVFVLRNGQLTQPIDGKLIQRLDNCQSKGTGAEEESESDDEDYCTKGYVGGKIKFFGHDDHEYDASSFAFSNLTDSNFVRRDCASSSPRINMDKALLNAAGLMDFPELYPYIREREPRPPVETEPPAPIGEQTLQETFNQVNYDSNNDGKVDIKDTDLADHHVIGTELQNLLNSDIKLQHKLGIFKPDRAAYYIQDGPLVIYSLGAKLGDNIGNVYKIFSTIDSKILPPYAKYHTMHPEQKEFKGYCKQIQQLDKSTSFQVNISGKLDKKDCEFSGIHVLDNYQNMNDANGNIEGQPETASVVATTDFVSALRSNLKSVLDEIIIRYQTLSPIPEIFVPVKNHQLVFPATAMVILGDKLSKVGKGLSWVNDKIVKPIVLPAAKQFSDLISDGGLIMKGIEVGSSALDAINGQGSKYDSKQKFIDLMDDAYLRNLPIESLIVPFKSEGEYHYLIKEIKPKSQMLAMLSKETIISLSDSDHDETQIQNSFISIVLTANLQFGNKFDQFNDAYKDDVVLFVGLKSESNIIREYTVYHRGKTIDGCLQNDATTESFIYSTIKPKSEKNNRKNIHSLNENIHKFDTSACRTYITMREIEEVIGQQTNVLFLMQVRFKISVPLDDLLIFSAFTDYPNGISGQQKLMDIDLFFRNWSLTFQYSKQFTQLGCTADLITSIRTEQLSQSGLKNLICEIAPVTISIKNYVVTEVTANMAGFKAADECVNRVRNFFSTRTFVVPALRVEIWPLPTSATLTGIRTSYNIPISHITDFVLLFPKDARYQLFEATDEFEDTLTTPRNTVTQRLKAHNDLTSFITSVELRGASIYQGVTDCYQNVDANRKRTPPPILCTVHDTFWLFSPNQGGSCKYDITHSFDEVVSEIGA
ncbi:MAG: hypothetical protein EZS28_010817 [Streblomastix strix]|uniref:Uncharacterized protein n=1 Tax=Streblomastix strix TaxID=222440 RepID=A0A5J4WH12_9EUKA|nr:MAG: hypothetical protein EZS28_010817 [Streblomastix strix]